MFRKNRGNDLVNVDDTPKKECTINFTGDNIDKDTCKIKINRLFNALKCVPKCESQPSTCSHGTLEIGNLVELVCSTPLEEKCNAFNLIKSKKAPVVIAGGIDKISEDNIKAKYVLIVSADKIKRTNNKAGSAAKKLHKAFHGIDMDIHKAVDVEEADWLVFFGHLAYIVYKVPDYSERRGVPFIHEAGDKGDGVKKARRKPLVCVSPERDFLVMYGTEFEFTRRGIIG